MPLQKKSVTITKNGTTEIVPDNGYALEKIEIKVNIPEKERYYHVELEDSFMDYDHFMLWSIYYSSIKIINPDTNKIIIREVGNLYASDMPNIIGFSINCDIQLGVLGGTLISGAVVAENLPTFYRTEVTKEEYYSII